MRVRSGGADKGAPVARKRDRQLNKNDYAQRSMRRSVYVVMV